MITDIIFDWDGTLVDTLPFLKETFDKTFEHLHLVPMSYEQIRKKIHENFSKDMFVVIFGEENAYNAKRFFHTHTLRYHLQQLQATKGAQIVLDFCLQHNIRCHIFSNKKTSILQQEMEMLGWNKYFSTICGAGDLSQDKPTLQACNDFCTKADLTPNNTLFIGDGPADTVSARFLNCPVAIICTNESYIGPKPDYTLQNIQEILPLLQTMLY